MTIFISGSSGILGNWILDKLKSETRISITTLGRKNCDIPWQLGEIPNLIEPTENDILLHLAWDSKARLKSYHRNVGGSIQIADYFLRRGSKVIFFSSVSAMSMSYYGRSKREVETAVLELGGTVLRLGLVTSLNRYQTQFPVKRRIFGLSTEIIKSELSDVYQTLNICIFEKESPNFILAVSQSFPFRDIFGDAIIKLDPLLRKMARRRIYFGNQRLLNFIDSVYSVVTTPNLRELND